MKPASTSRSVAQQAASSTPRVQPLGASERMAKRTWIGRLGGGGLAVVLTFALLLILSVRKVEDPDVGFHLKSGEQILSGSGVARTDRVSYALAGRPDVDLYWAYQ